MAKAIESMNGFGELDERNSADKPDPRRFVGCLVGLAVGDSLGSTLEFLNKEKIVRQYGVLRDLVGGGWLDLEPGETTDDTGMMLAIARSLAERQDFDPDDIATRFVAWLDSQPPDVGNLTREAIILIKSGKSWEDAGKIAYARTGGAGNGSVMRCAPVGLFRWNDPERLVADSITSSQITHRAPAATVPCVIVNRIIAHAVRGEPDKLPADYAGGLADMPEEIVHALEELPTLKVEQLRTSGYAVHTLQTALWCYTHTSSFEDAVVTAANLGGDADTQAAVCGALAGAHYGVDAIPQRWLARLRGREEIEQIALKIYELVCA